MSLLKIKKKIILNNTKNSVKAIPTINDKGIRNNIKLKFFEDITNSNYLIDNLKHIKSNFTEDEFIFLMGSDSFEEMDKWKNYLDIFDQMPIAVFNRNEKLYNPLTSIAAEKFKNNQIKLSDAKLIFTKSPAWIFIRDFNVSESSTAIRNNK